MQQQFEADAVRAALDVETVTYRGTGSFGETWRADFDGHDAAYKIIHKDGYDTERLTREIEGYRRVSNEHVVRLFDVRTIEVAKVERPVMIFEYIPGCDLSEIIRAKRPTEHELRTLASALLKGIAAVHAADLLHRDLKPANIALRDRSYEAAVILDLGLAKLLDVESITIYPARVGTTLYMSPEQLRQERALRASDLWAIGEILFEAATGRHPFFQVGESLTYEEALARMASPPEIPDDIANDVADVISQFLSEPAYRRGTTSKALSKLL